MKKKYKYILIITIMMFVFVGKGNAKNIKVPLCQYNTKDDKKIEIMYEKNLSIASGSATYNVDFDVFVNNKDTDDLKILENGKNVKITKGEDVFLTPNTCPLNVYKDTSWGTNDYCFDNDGSCLRSKWVKLELKEPPKNVYKENIGENIPFIEGIDSCVGDGSCKPLCYYSDNNASDYAFIYYFPYEDTFKSSFSWKDNNKVYELKKDSGTAFIGPNELEQLRNAVCPINIYKDENLFDEDEVCFDSDGEYCTTKLSGHFSSKELLEEIEPITLLTKEQLDKYIPEDNKLSYEEVKERVESEYNIKVYEICAYTDIDEKNPTAYQFFIVNTGTEFRFFDWHKFLNVHNEYTSLFGETKETKEFKYRGTCTEYPIVYREFRPNPFTNTNEEWYGPRNFGTGIVQRTLPFDWSDGEEDYLDYIPVGEDENCESLLGEDLVSELNSYMLYIKIAVPIIIIVMGSLDFGKAFIASDEDAMKKAQKKFIMRLIIGMTIFFIPTLVNALIDVADQIWNLTKGNGTCGIKF